MGENCHKCGSEQLSEDCPNPRRNTGTAWAGDEEGGGGDDDGWFAAYEFKPSLNWCLMLKGKGVLRPRLLLRPTT